MTRAAYWLPLLYLCRGNHDASTHHDACSFFLIFMDRHWSGITQWVFLYILLEFQSKIDSTMPLRLMHYVACFYDHLLKTRETTVRQGLPPIFPMVLYNGSQRWSACQDIYDMVQSRGRI